MRELSQVTAAVLRALPDDMPDVCDIELRPSTSLDGAHVNIHIDTDYRHIARWAEHLDSPITITRASTFFHVAVKTDVYRHPVHVWTHFDHGDMRRLSFEYGLDEDANEWTITAAHLLGVAT